MVETADRGMDRAWKYQERDNKTCHEWNTLQLTSKFFWAIPFTDWSKVLGVENKNQPSKFQFDQDRGPAWKAAKADVTSSLNIVNIVIYFTECFVL